MSDANPSETKRDEHGRFIVPPVSPGRPKGSRNKLGEAFLADMLADWETYGAETIVKVREEKPDQYLKVVASILPKELNVKVSDLDELTDEQLEQRYAAIAQALIAAGFGTGSGDRETQGPQQAGDLQTIQ